MVCPPTSSVMPLALALPGPHVLLLVSSSPQAGRARARARARVRRTGTSVVEGDGDGKLRLHRVAEAVVLDEVLDEQLGADAACQAGEPERRQGELELAADGVGGHRGQLGIVG